MNEGYFKLIASELNVGVASVAATAKLFADGATVPFIARYRKEATGSLDEVAIEQIRDRLKQLAELDARRETILRSIDEQGKLSDTLRQQLMTAATITRLEDLYLPYKPKRKTRASVARERGLEPLAQQIFEDQDGDASRSAAQFVDPAREVADVDAALTGARDIIAEWVSDDAEGRAEIRQLFLKEGILRSEVLPTMEEAGAKYRDYFDWQEPVNKVPSHRLLAIRRGSQEGFLAFSIRPEESRAHHLLRRRFVQGRGANAKRVDQTLEDAYRRLLAPTLETEVRLLTRKKADAEAIEVFAGNVRELLMAAPLGQKRVLAIDPGFRTGSKVVVLGPQGDLLEETVIYPGQGAGRDHQASEVIQHLVKQHRIEMIAIGNGTGSRETEQFVNALPLQPKVPVVVVSESGASVYSASAVAREEFPDKDITVRGAVSIGRRLMDPLAELVKIDPKSIGVGQYQHDVDERRLKEKLDDVVINCVNKVGVELNTASEQLLSYVSGLSQRIAGNIVQYRRENGPFDSRKKLMKVEGVGPRAFEQAAGFLRVRGGIHPLDASAVHPERYDLVQLMANDLGVQLEVLIRDASVRQKIRLESYCSGEVGMPTLKDIMMELEKPGRDPREKFQAFAFSEEVHKMEDLKPGQKLPGKVTNVAAFGAFVDVGVHQDGLVHVSQLSDNFVKDPTTVVKVGQTVEVTVVEVDIPRKRIGLSMKSNPDFSGQAKGPRSPENRRPAVGNRGPAKPRSENLGGNWFDQAIKRKG